MEKINEEKIKEQAKEILDKFAKALEKVDEKQIDISIEREIFERIENPSKENKLDQDFKEKILNNAPQKDSDFIIAEKGNWK